MALCIQPRRQLSHPFPCRRKTCWLEIQTLTYSGANSTRATISLSKAAAAAGADAVIVIPPGYFAGAMSREALSTFFADVASASPIPVMMYNYPGAAGGIDMDSDLVISIADTCPNVCGIKLTCGAVGKLTRITAATHARGFLTLGGFADFLAPTVAGGRAHGAIMGLGNIYPYALARIFALAQKVAQEPNKADLKEANELQDLASGADAAFAKAGIAGTKYWLRKTKPESYPSARIRRPLLEFDEQRLKALEANEDVKRFLEVERKLQGGKANGVNGSA
jgi:dihydrodipicolinate synthase/N-acetylneuraminate lyase